MLNQALIGEKCVHRKKKDVKILVSPFFRQRPRAANALCLYRISLRNEEAVCVCNCWKILLLLLTYQVTNEKAFSVFPTLLEQLN